jgi:endonuclease G, mitochondrial
MDKLSGSDVFVSYARSDAALAKRLAETLWNEGFSVWFDERIPAGADWDEMLKKRLDQARAILVLWTPRSVGRPWVLKEADHGRRQKKLIPVMLEDVVAKLPPRLREMQVAKLFGWDGFGPHPELSRLLSGLALLAPARNIANVRPGFDTGFLGVDLPLPAVEGVAEELRYLHFSVVVNPARRLPWYVAYNLAPANGSVERGERWLPDPNLPVTLQPQDVHFRGTGFDRGHMVAPLHVSWGSDREAEIANHQTFYWPNNVPQHDRMNRGWWWTVEQWERNLAAKSGKVVGYAGPVLRRDDPVHTRSEEVIGRLRVRANFRLPQRFWKLVVVRGADGGLACAAFFFDQAALLAENTPTGSPPGRFQVSLDLLKAETGLVFDGLEGAASLPTG